MVDDIVEGDLRSGAIAFAKAKAAAHEIRKVREIAISRRGDDKRVSRRARGCGSRSRKRPKGCGRPTRWSMRIEAGLRAGFDAGSIRERELFADCVVSTESKALRHLFFAEREVAKVPDVPKDTPTKDIKRAAVVGAGTMGGGIAMNYANAGIPVLLKDVDEAALDRGLATIRKNYEITMSKGKMTADQVEKTMALITPTTSYDGFDQVDIVTEAVFENMDLKKATFAELGKVTRPDCILASNSSTLDIDQFAAASGRPAQVLGPSLLQPGERHEAARNRSRPRHQQGSDRDVAQAGEEARQGRRRRRQLLRLRRQPDARAITCARPTCCSRKARACRRSTRC